MQTEQAQSSAQLFELPFGFVRVQASADLLSLDKIKSVIPKTSEIIDSISMDNSLLLFVMPKESAKSIIPQDPKTGYTLTLKGTREQYIAATSYVDKRSLYIGCFETIEAEILRTHLQTVGNVRSIDCVSSTGSAPHFIALYATEQQRNDAIARLDCTSPADNHLPIRIMPFFPKPSPQEYIFVLQMAELPAGTSIANLKQQFAAYPSLMAVQVCPAGLPALEGYALFSNEEDANRARDSSPFPNTFLFPPVHSLYAQNAFGLPKPSLSLSASLFLAVYDNPQSITADSFLESIRRFSTPSSYNIVKKTSGEMVAYASYYSTKDLAAAFCGFQKEGKKVEIIDYDLYMRMHSWFSRERLPFSWKARMAFLTRIPGGIDNEKLRSEVEKIGKADFVMMESDTITGEFTHRAIVLMKSAKDVQTLLAKSAFDAFAQLYLPKQGFGPAPSQPYKYPACDSKTSPREFIKRFIDINAPEHRKEAMKAEVEKITVTQTYEIVKTQQKLLSWYNELLGKTN